MKEMLLHIMCIITIGIDFHNYQSKIYKPVPLYLWWQNKASTIMQKNYQFISSNKNYKLGHAVRSGCVQRLDHTASHPVRVECSSAVALQAQHVCQHFGLGAWDPMWSGCRLKPLVPKSECEPRYLFHHWLPSEDSTNTEISAVLAIVL